MDAFIILTIILFWLSVVLMASHTLAYLKQKRSLLSHVSEVTYSDFAAPKKKAQNRRAATLQKVIKYADEFSELGERVNFFSENEDVAVWLKKSGNKLGLTVGQFQGTKIFLLIIGFGAGVLSFIIGLPLSQYGLILLPVIGYFIPIIVVRLQAKQRQEALRLELPDFLDTISTSLQAGVSLDQALKEVIRFFEGPLKEEFSRFLYEVDLGVPRDTAYRNLLDRNDNQEFQGLIKGLLQGEKLGVPIATTFKVQADALRQIREEQVKELAAKASPKVTLVTTFIVAPVSILMIAGLMILNLIFGDNSIFKLLG